ncbi:flavodoxin [Pseudomonas rhodesiae]|uniref:flavodoxin n=1 Tax=Pseudomonas rhodesiae TaxID=76760 RepID=UPI002899050A|nr:flavodoxin [Pseudomonas rhodesiae]
MTATHDSTRRLVMTALATLPLAGMATTQSGGVRRMGSRTLVAYFSRTGNTRVIAGLIHRQLETDLFEIRPATPYPEDYLATVDQARQERDSNYEPALESTISDISNYDTVFLGFPIWGETAPAVIRSFLSKHDLSGKTLIPFVTHGGYGLGNSQSVIASHASNAHLLTWLVMEADQERRTMETVMEWLKGVNVKA